MKSMKNILLYAGYSLFALFMIFLIIVNIGFFEKNDVSVFADYGIAFAAVVLVVLFVTVMLYTASLFTYRIDDKFRNIINIVLIAAISIWAVLFRAYYLFGVRNIQDGDGIGYVIISFVLSLLNLFITYMIGRLAIGKIGGIVALLINGSMISEIASLGTFDVKMIIKTFVLTIILLYVIFFNEYKKEDSSFVKKFIAVLLMACICGAVMVMSLYTDSTVMIPLILVMLLSVSMLIRGWLYSILFIISFAVLSVFAIITGSVMGFDSEYTLEQMVNDKASMASSIMSSEEGVTGYISAGYTKAFAECTDYSISVMGASYKYETLIFLVCIVLSLVSVVFMIIKKRSVFLPFLIYLILVYPFDNDQLFIVALFASYGLQQIYCLIRNKQNNNEETFINPAEYIEEEEVREKVEEEVEEEVEEKAEEETAEETYASVYKSIYGSEEYLDDIVISRNDDEDEDVDEDNETEEMSASIPVINVPEPVEIRQETVNQNSEHVGCVIKKSSEINENISDDFRAHWETRRNRTKKHNKITI